MKIFSAIAVGAVLALASCAKSQFADAEREPSPEIEGAYFDASLFGYSFGVGNATPTVTIPILRSNKSGAVTAKLAFESKDIDKLLNLPSSVTFADGQDKAEITFTADVANMEFNATVEVTLTISDNNTPYGLSTATFGVVKALIWGPVGIAKYTAGGFNATFGVPPTTYTKYQKAEGLEYYRLVNTYRPTSEYGGYTLGWEDIWAEEVLPGDNYILIDATNPDAVDIKSQKLGFDWSYGEMILQAAFYADNKYSLGKKVGNIITIDVAFDIGDGRGGYGVDIIEFDIQAPVVDPSPGDSGEDDKE